MTEETSALLDEVFDLQQHIVVLMRDGYDGLALGAADRLVYIARKLADELNTQVVRRPGGAA
jgi:hypothetical protein